MKQNLTSINILLDRSGSMIKLTNETLAGFNSFLAEQKAVPGAATLTLATFASDYTLIHDSVPLDSVSDLTPQDYKTGGYTCLLYALGKTIDSVGQKLASLPEEERPSKVILIVMTDGAENHSHRLPDTFTRKQVFDKITHQQDKYSWTIAFLGCSQDQVDDAINLGITTANSIAFSADGAGVAASYNSISSNMAAYRGGNVAKVNFFDQDKQVIVPAPIVIINK